MEYIKLWTNQLDKLKDCTLEEKGAILEACINYNASGTEPEFPASVDKRFMNLLWADFRQMMDSNARKAEILKANGSHGGRPKNQPETKEKPNENQTQTKAEPKETTIKNKEIRNKNYELRNKEECEEKRKRFSPPTIEEVTAYCRERNNNVDPERFIDFYASKGWRVGNQPMKDWRACVRTWEQRDRNITPIKKVSAQQYEQRDYTNEDDSFDDEMKRLMQMTGG